MWAANSGEPVDVGVELGDQRLDVDAVHRGAVVVERDERLLEEVERATGGPAARAQVEAAARGVAAVEADFYPNVNLTAFAGLQSIGLSQLFEASDRIVGAGPALHLPVFNRGELRGALQSQQAQLDQSVGQYNQTLLDAVREVADVVANWRALERESAEQQIALEAAQRSYELTSERYRAGLDNYLSVLSSQNQVLQAQGLRAQLQARRLSFSVDLVRALGGGYAPRSSAT